jgi:actin related protein 2/3 complex, subunit 3
MPGAYHSSFNSSEGLSEISGFPILSLKTRGTSAGQLTRGPATLIEGSNEEDDIIDEALKLFRPNVMFRNFEINGGGDKILVYLLLFTHQCLKRIEKKPIKAEAVKELMQLAQGAHFIPGDSGWPLGTIIAAPKTQSESDQLRLYFKQLREALVPRLLERVFSSGESAVVNKHWLMFAKRKFMGKEFP